MHRVILADVLPRTLTGPLALQVSFGTPSPWLSHDAGGDSLRKRERLETASTLGRPATAQGPLPNDFSSFNSEPISAFDRLSDGLLMTGLESLAGNVSWPIECQ